MNDKELAEEIEQHKLHLGGYLTEAQWDQIIAALRRGPEPLAMLMFCPRCSKQHIDAPKGEWANPPHATHTCQFCGLLWRPSNENTAGVKEIQQLETKHAERIAASFPLSQEAVRNEVLEMAARLCDNWRYAEPNYTAAGRWYKVGGFMNAIAGATDSCAAAIRALKREPNAAGQAGQSEITAPSNEGHAAGPAPAAPESRLSTLCPECGATDGHWKDCPRHSGKSESETPETDAALIPDEVTWMEGIVTADFARSLERRLSEYQAKHTSIMKEADRRYDELVTALSLAQTEIKGHMRVVEDLSKEDARLRALLDDEFQRRRNLGTQLEQAQSRIARLEKVLKTVKTQIVNLPRSSTADTIHSAVDEALKDRA